MVLGVQRKNTYMYMYHKLKNIQTQNMFLQLFCQNTQLNILTIKLKNEIFHRD